LRTPKISVPIYRVISSRKHVRKNDKNRYPKLITGTQKKRLLTTGILNEFSVYNIVSATTSVTADFHPIYGTITARIPVHRVPEAIPIGLKIATEMNKAIAKA